MFQTLTFRDSGVDSFSRIIDLTAWTGTPVIHLFLDARDPDGMEDVAIVEQGSWDGSSFIPTAVLANTGATSGLASASGVLGPGGPRFVRVAADVSYYDFNAFFRLATVVTNLDTAPLIFAPDRPGPGSFAGTDTPGELLTDGRFTVFHQAGLTGLNGLTPFLLDLDARRVSIAPGRYEVVDVLSGEGVGNAVLLSDEVSVRFDDAFLPASFFTLEVPLALGAADLTLTGMMLDDRGVVFGFLAELPAALGGVVVDAAVEDRGAGLLGADNAIIGPAAWALDDAQDLSLLDLFRADLSGGVARWHAGSGEWRLSGGLALRDVLGIGSLLALETAPNAHAFAAIGRSGFSGTLLGSGTARLEVGSFGAGQALLLDDIVLFPELSLPTLLAMDAEIGLQLGRQRVQFASSFDVTMNPGLRVGTGAAFAWEASADPGQAPAATGFAGLSLLGIEGSVTTLDGEPGLAITADLAFGGANQPMISLVAVLEAAGHGLSGTGLLTHSSALLGMIGATGDLAFDSRLGTLSGSSGNLVLAFDLLGARLRATVAAEFLQQEGAQGGLAMRGTGEVTEMPAWLAGLFGVTAGFAVAFDAALTPGNAAASHVTLSAPLLAAGAGTADFGLRYWFDERLELLGGLGLGEAALDGAGGGPGPFSFALATPAPRLVLRAEGAVDAGTVQLTLPGGAALGQAQFAAAGIAVLEDDAGGLTLLVTDAAAGSYVLAAAGATGFSGFAAALPLTLAVGAVATTEGPGLRAVAAGATTFRIHADGDAAGFDGATVFTVTGDEDGVLELPFAALGLPPGTHHLHVTAEAPGLLPVRAYLPGAVAITGVADLVVSGEAVVRAVADGGQPALYTLAVTVTNEGTAQAILPSLDILGGAIGGVALPGLAPGETLRLLLELEGALPPVLVAQVTNGGFEAELDDNRATLRLPAPDAPGAHADVAWLMEDGPIELFPTGNDRLAGAAAPAVTVAPLHGTAAFDGLRLTYTPDPDFAGLDVLTYAAGGSSAQVWLEVRPVNDAPVLLDGFADVTVTLGGTLSARPAAGRVLDVDDATFSHALARVDGGALPGWLRFDAATGRLSGTPGEADAGSLLLRLTLTDGGDASVSDEFRLSVVAPGGGTPGPDQLVGGAGADLLVGIGGNDTLEGRGGADTLDGGAGDDTLEGGEGADLLLGLGGGADLLRGGAGDDLYLLVDGAAVVEEAAGGGADAMAVARDAGWALAAHVETGLLLQAARRMVAHDGGAVLASFLDGAAATLTGGAGADVLWGSAAAGDVLSGMGGADVLGGLGGGDSLIGGAGDDAYLIAAAADAVTELAGGGEDIAWVSVDGWAVAAQVEMAVLLDAARILSGGAGRQVLVGNAALGSTLDGGAGDDALLGGAFADSFTGGAGDDGILSGGGADRLLFGAPGFGHDVVAGLVSGAGFVLDFRGSGIAGPGSFAVTDYGTAVTFAAAQGSVTLFGIGRAEAEAAMLFA